MKGKTSANNQAIWLYIYCIWMASDKDHMPNMSLRAVGDILFYYLK